MKRRITPIVLLLMIISITACKKDQSLNQPKAKTSAVVFQLKAVNPVVSLERTVAGASITSNRIEGVNIQWNSATAFVSQLKFEAQKSDSEVEFKVDLQKSIDLFQIDNSLGNMVLPAGNYKEVEFKVKLSPDGNSPALLLKGRLKNGIDSMTIIFRADESIEVKGEKHNVTVNDTTIHKAITSLDLAKLTHGISIDVLGKAVKTGNDILITSGINKDLYKIMVKNLRDLGDEEEFH